MSSWHDLSRKRMLRSLSNNLDCNSPKLSISINIVMVTDSSNANFVMNQISLNYIYIYIYIYIYYMFISMLSFTVSNLELHLSTLSTIISLYLDGSISGHSD